LLLNVAAQRDYLSLFLPPLDSFLPQEERAKGLIDALGLESWPDRISTLPLEKWLNKEGVSQTAQFWEMNIDLKRLTLVQKLSSVSATNNWTSWIIDHPAYRGAVPHNSSFVREADFDGLLLVLTHEITHVLSLVGVVDNALNSLRVAAFNAELTMWSVTPGASEETLRENIAKHGHVALKRGDAASLFRAEQGVELSLKAQILQDIWTPWFEGLAIFGEGAADPSLDSLRIGHVTHALRNLVDFQWEAFDEGGNEEEVNAHLARFVADFDARCSAAIARRGPRRLRFAYLNKKDVPYLAGYIAVRGVVSAWRARALQPLTGAEAFNLLLHATRFAAVDAIPNLSLRAEIFVEAAMIKMRDWVCRLANIDRLDIQNFVNQPLEDDEHFSFAWQDGRLIKKPLGPGTEPKTFAADAARWLRQALASLTRPEDDSRLIGANAETNFLLREASQALRKYSDTAKFEERLKLWVARVGYFRVLQTLLPIGRTDARFFINADSQRPDAFLNVQILTTEEHEEDHKPSINGMTIRIDRITAEQIASSYRRLAIPHIEVTRVIDLGGFTTPNRHFTGVHIMAFHYNNWLDIRGPTGFIDRALSENPEVRANLRKMIKARLYPDPVERAELEKIAQGDLGAARTRDWINKSEAWLIGSRPVEVGNWANHVRILAERVLDAGQRRSRQNKAARALVAALFADEPLARDLTEKDFDTLTESAPHRRGEMNVQLFKTAQRPSSEAAVADAAAVFAACGFPILSKGAQGWDVRAAVTTGDQGEQDGIVSHSEQ
jgi:hypothetical protein